MRLILKILSGLQEEAHQMTYLKHSVLFVSWNIAEEAMKEARTRREIERFVTRARLFLTPEH